VATIWVEDAETMIEQEQEDWKNAEKAQLIIRKSDNAFQEVLDAIWDSMNDLRSSENEEDVENTEDIAEDIELANLSEDDKPGWVIGTISKTVQHQMRSYQKSWKNLMNCCNQDREMRVTSSVREI